MLTDKEKGQLDDLEKCWDDYNQRKATIMAQIFTMVPDSVLIEILNLATAKEIWEAVCAKHEMKALTVKVDMWRQMYEMRCKDESNIRTHLETLMSTQEQLAGMNAALTDDDLVTVILSSLPKSYRSLINVIMMSAMHAKVQLEPDHVVGMLIDEFERLEIKDHQSKASESQRKCPYHNQSPHKGRYRMLEMWKKVACQGRMLLQGQKEGR